MSNYLDAISGTLSQFGVEKHLDKVKSMVGNYTEVELKVRDATNLEAWGPTGTQMNEIAQMTYQQYVVVCILPVHIQPDYLLEWQACRCI